MRVSPIIGRASGASPVGQQIFTASGSLVVPAGVSSVCAVAIGPGAEAQYSDPLDYWISGPGGGLAYSNAVAVTPGETLTVTVSATDSQINRGGTLLLRASKGSVNVDTGGAPAGQGIVGQSLFSGGNGGGDFGVLPSGGGAAGYTSAGQGGGYAGTSGFAGGGTSPNGGGAGGLAGTSGSVAAATYGGGGGPSVGPGPGCVRIIWGDGRAFPNTNTGDV